MHDVRDEMAGHDDRRRRIDERRQEERAKILEAATRLFFENGYAGTTMEAVADEMCVTKPTIYWYFRSKHEILAAICLRSAEAAIETILKVEERRDPLFDVFESCRRIALISTFDIRTNAIFFREAHALSANVRARMSAAGRVYSTAMGDLLERARAAGALHFRDTRVTARAVGGIIASLHRWYRPDGAMAPRELAWEIASMMVRAAGAREFEPRFPEDPAASRRDQLRVAEEPWAAVYWWIASEE